MYLFLFILIFLLYGAMNFYIGSRALRWFKLFIPAIKGKFFWPVYTVLALLYIIGRIIPHSPVAVVVDRIGNYWLAVFMYLFLFILGMDILKFAARLIKLLPADFFTKPKPKLISGTVISAALLILMVYGTVNAKMLKTVKYNIDINKDSGIDGLNAVMIADTHIGYNCGYKQVEKLTKKINAMNPDIIFIAGDIFDGSYDKVKDADKIAESFRGLKSKYGTYAVLGNHDGGKTTDKIIDFLEQANINFLSDSHVTVDGKFIVAGMIDSTLDSHVTVDGKFIVEGMLDSTPIGGSVEMKRSDITSVMNNVDKNLPVIMLDHKPEKINEAEDAGVDLILCGHTHRGQIFPANIITDMLFVIDWGHLDREDFHAVVTSGVTAWGPPLKIGTNSEIVQLEISFSK